MYFFISTTYVLSSTKLSEATTKGVPMNIDNTFWKAKSTDMVINKLDQALVKPLIEL